MQRTAGQRTLSVALLIWAIALAARSTPAAQSPAPGVPQYAADGTLVRPADYREWAG